MRSIQRISIGGAVFGTLHILAAGASAQGPCRGGPLCGGGIAATLTVSDMAVPMVPPGTTDLVVPAFDPALGTLVRVDVVATAPVSGYLGVENLNANQGCDGGTWNVSSHIEVQFVRGGFDVLASDLDPSGAFGSFSAFDGAIDFRGTSGETANFSSMVQTDSCFDEAEELADFESVVPGAALTFTVNTTNALYEWNSNCGSATLMFFMGIGAGIEVTYTYCPATGLSFCSGDGSGAACPCGNAGATGSGCANASFASGASLVGSGDASVAADTLLLAVSGSTPDELGLFFQGDNAIAGGAGLPFGDGLRCAGGNVVRLEVSTALGSGAAASTVAISPIGGVAPGDIKRYQWWYRDPTGSPCGSGFNLSNGLEVTWAP